METKKKKPTIEEIIKGLDNLSYYHDEKGVHEFLRGAIGLIQDQKQEIGFLEKDYIELDLETRKLRTELDKELAEREEFTKKAKAEIERLTKENFVLYRDRFTKKELDDISDFKVKKATAELQKQVDELKSNQVIECHGMLKGCDMVKQAVKDTAKECYEIFKFYKQHYYDIPLDLVAREIEEKTGVEVE